MAYEELTKEQQDKKDAALKRLRNSKVKANALNPQLSQEEEVEYQKHSALIGQLKQVVFQFSQVIYINHI